MEDRNPIADLMADWFWSLMAGWGAALALLLWALAGLLYRSMFANVCTGESCLAQPMSQRTADMGPAYLLVMMLVVALLATYGSALGTIVVAGRNRDRLSAGGLLIILALSLVALCALHQDGHPELTFVDVLYGFSPDGFAFHPFAYVASFALMILPAPVALVYYLLHERARRASNLVSLATVVGAVSLLVAIRLAPAVSLPT
ncbi:MAG TPA: hypothetical protein VH591_19225 [Ktedonobacterales bacterium]|jgi:hypothetical protein